MGLRRSLADMRHLLAKHGPKPRKLRRGRKPAVEVLEDRLTPSAMLTPLPTIPGCTMLRLGDADYSAHVRVYNARTQIAPALFAICSTASAVSGVFSWVKANNLPFVVRCGGHSYEGFSCSSGTVIDVRNLKSVTFDRPTMTVTVGVEMTLTLVMVDSASSATLMFLAARKYEKPGNAEEAGSA